MAFDPKKMKVLKRLIIKDPDADDRRFVVELYSYNKGEPKVSLKTQVRNSDDEWVYRKAFGISSPNVARAVGKAFTKMAKELNK